MKKVVSIIARKGGASKSTTAIHLAAALSIMHPSLRVAVADTDTQQRTATKWIERSQGAIGVTVHQVASDGEGLNMRKEIDQIKADILIIDTPPALASVSLRAGLYADLILIPSSASICDLETAHEAISCAREAIEIDPRKKFLIIPSRVQNNTSAGQGLRNSLSEWGPVSRATISLRVAYAEAAIVGLGVAQYAPDSPAAAEMRLLAEEVSEILNL